RSSVSCLMRHRSKQSLPGGHFSEPISEVMFVKTTAQEAKPQIESERYQLVRDRAKHAFQWSRGVASCSCGRWTLWGATLESAKRSHGLHRVNLPDTAVGTDKAPGGQE